MSGNLLEGMGVDTAEFSPCRLYRYALWRVLDPAKPPVMFVGLNPSTADETRNDPTVRRCIGFARSWGFGTLIMSNIFAFRATDPRDMRAVDDPVGPENDRVLLELARGAKRIVAAWGVHGQHRGRGSIVAHLLQPFGLLCLGVTKDGHPRHPLMLRKDALPVSFSPAL